MLNYFRDTNIPFLLFVTLLFPPLVLTVACSDKEEAAKLPTQVAARVNGDEITVHQINNVLERTPNVTPEVAEQAKRRILERLIDQQLAVQKAVEGRLDRSPEVMQALEAARREVLVRAYLESLAEGVPQRYEWDAQNRKEIKAYYSAHPELFAQRRIFTIEEIGLAANDDVARRLREYMSRGRSMQEIAGWLKSQDIEFTARRVQRAAEQMSLEHLPKVQAMKAGQIELFELGNERFQVIRVVDVKEAPIDEATAAPRIQQFLSNLQSREILAIEMRRIRDQAQIEYLGEFAVASPDLE